MDKKMRARLEAAGWRVGSVQEFLGLSDDEMAYIEIRLVLSDQLKKRRAEKRISQVKLAKLLSSSQSRVAKMEAADPTVSLDLLIRSLIATGHTPAEIGKVIARVGG